MFHAGAYRAFLNHGVFRRAATEDELRMCALASIPNFVNQAGVCGKSIAEAEAEFKKHFSDAGTAITIDHVVQSIKTASSNSIQTWQATNFLQYQHDLAVCYRKKHRTNLQRDRAFCATPEPIYW